MLEERYVSYDEPRGRLGNNLIQYLACKLVSVVLGHSYIETTEFNERIKDRNESGMIVKLTEKNLEKELLNQENKNKHVLLYNSYFQKSRYFYRYRDELIKMIMTEENTDMFLNDRREKKKCLEYLLYPVSRYKLKMNDIVVHVRLDDYIMYPTKKSAILNVFCYHDMIMEAIKEIENDTDESTIYIVCDVLRTEWEREYIRSIVSFCKKQNMRVIQVNDKGNASLSNDIAMFRDANIFVQSNSTLAWIMSFLSSKRKRFIPCMPRTYIFRDQCLQDIEATDVLYHTDTTYRHRDIEKFHHKNENIIPLSMSIPDECVVTEIPKKDMLLAPLIPGDLSTYVYNKYQEKEYNEMYQKSRFAKTKKKGGWDCLRHYEILMNGCIPIFEKIEECPELTITTFPKHLNYTAKQLYETWQDDESHNERYNILCNQYLEHTRKFCTMSAHVEYFLGHFKNHESIRNILMITCDRGINYTKESLWIGLKRYIKNKGGNAIEYGQLSFIYDDWDDDKEMDFRYYGHAVFTLKNTLPQSYKRPDMTNEEMRQSIKTRFWDLIIYGKVGPDELYREYPFINEVSENYTDEEVAFLYGGDEPFDMINEPSHSHINMFNRQISHEPYINHLNRYKHIGKCFVRELDMSKEWLKKPIDMRIYNNPFVLDIPDKEIYTPSELLEIQEKVSRVDITSLLRLYYPPGHDTGYVFEDYRSRIHRSILSTHFLDPLLWNIPELIKDQQDSESSSSSSVPYFKRLYEINGGGDHTSCIVCMVPFEQIWDNDPFMKDEEKDGRKKMCGMIVDNIKNTGYEGYVYINIGGFPTPTFTEMKYIATPYAFKILLMQETYKMGFQYVIWIDAPCAPIQSPQKLFDYLHNHDLLAMIYNTNWKDFCFKEIIELLNHLNGIDMGDARHVVTTVFGLNMGSPTIQCFVKDYYNMLSIGLPFLSIYPEETVISSLFQKEKYRHIIEEIDNDPDIPRRLFLYDEEYTTRNDTSSYYFVRKTYEKKSCIA